MQRSAFECRVPLEWLPLRLPFSGHFNDAFPAMVGKGDACGCQSLKGHLTVFSFPGVCRKMYFPNLECVRLGRIAFSSCNSVTPRLEPRRGLRRSAGGVFRSGHGRLTFSQGKEGWHSCHLEGRSWPACFLQTCRCPAVGRQASTGSVQYVTTPSRPTHAIPRQAFSFISFFAALPFITMGLQHSFCLLSPHTVKCFPEKAVMQKCF